MSKALVITEAGNIEGVVPSLIKRAVNLLRFKGTTWKFTTKGISRGGEPERLLTVYGVAILPDYLRNPVQFAAVDENGKHWCFPKDSLYEHRISSTTVHSRRITVRY